MTQKTVKRSRKEFCFHSPLFTLPTHPVFSSFDQPFQGSLLLFSRFLCDDTSTDAQSNASHKSVLSKSKRTTANGWTEPRTASNTRCTPSPCFLLFRPTISGVPESTTYNSYPKSTKTLARMSKTLSAKPGEEKTLHREATMGRASATTVSWGSVGLLVAGLGVRDLKLHSKHISDAALAHLALASLPIEHLDLEFCSRITDAGIAYLAALPLQHLSLRSCHRVTYAGLAHLASVPIQHLNLSHCRAITDSALAQLAALPLHYLDLEGCTQVTNAGLSHLAALPLKHLNLGACSLVTDTGLSHLAALPLQYLNLWRCSRITDAGLGHLAACPLQHLDLTGCKQITDAGLVHLTALPLQHLDLTGCRQVTDAGKSRTPGLLIWLLFPCNISILVQRLNIRPLQFKRHSIHRSTRRSISCNINIDFSSVKVYILDKFKIINTLANQIHEIHYRYIM
eukprot:g36143.t1